MNVAKKCSGKHRKASTRRKKSCIALSDGTDVYMLVNRKAIRKRYNDGSLNVQKEHVTIPVVIINRRMTASESVNDRKIKDENCRRYKEK